MSATSGSSSTTRMLKVMASSCHCGLPGTRQADREFGEFAGFAVDRDGAAMLLRDDVVADREAETGALAGRLGREERLKQLVPDFGRDAGAVVAHPDLDRLAQIAGRHLEGRAIGGLAIAAGALRGGVEAVADEVQEHAGHLLRRQLDRRGRGVEIAFQGDVEARILGAGAVIGEVGASSTRALRSTARRSPDTPR